MFSISRVDRVGSVVGDVADGLRSALVGDGEVGHPGLGALLCQQVRVTAPGGQPDQLEAVGVGGDDLERLGADGAGTAQHQDLEAATFGGQRDVGVTVARRV